MTCCQIRQGRDGLTGEEVEDLAGQPKPQHQTNLVVSWIGWVCARKERKPSALKEWMSG